MGQLASFFALNEPSWKAECLVTELRPRLFSGCSKITYHLINSNIFSFGTLSGAWLKNRLRQ
jgi:hypothetical protein